MPGVPSGRACEACRKLKKKCDEVQPTCGRCVRLKIECVGSGIRRFKFQFHNKSTSDEERSASGSPVPWDALTLSRTPDTAQASLRSALIKTMVPSTDVRYNLAYSYGDFIQTVPQRLGVNPALDAAVEALVAAHADVCLGSAVVPTRTLALHSQALHHLRTCLNDPATAHTIETLGAVLVLLMLQTFVGADENYWSQHYVGAAQILKARNYRYDPNDEFEAVLLATLRGPVLMEAILSGRLEFTPKEWQKFMGYRNPKHSHGERSMESVSLIPDLLQRRRKAQDPADLQQLQIDAQLHYGQLKANTEGLRSRLDALRDDPLTAASPISGLPMKYILQRQYAFSIFFTVTLNLLLRSFNAYDADIIADGENFADEVMAIAGDALLYKPIGSLYISICLMAAFPMTADPQKRAIIRQGYYAAVEGYPWAEDLSAGVWDCSLESGLRLPGLEVPDRSQHDGIFA